MVSLVCTLQNHRDDVNWCTFSGSLLATCSADKTIRVYHTRDFTELPFSPLSGHGYGVHCCCFSPCGQFLASCSTDATTVVWAMNTGEIEAVLEHPGRSPVRVCAFSPASSYLVSGAADGSLALWDFPSRRLHRTGAVPDTTIVACSFSPCGQLLATGSTYGDLRVWDLTLNQLHAEKYAHDLGVTCCQFSPQMMKDVAGCLVQFRFASCGQDSLLKVWLLSRTSPTGCKMALLHTLSAQSATVLSCAYSADGQLLISGSMDKSIAVYDANNGILLYILNQHERYVTACAFSPTDPLMAAGSMDKTVSVWRVEDGSSTSDKTLLDEAASGSHEAGRRWPGHSRLMVSEWSEDEVSAWLQEEGLESLVDTFKANNIDGAELLTLSKESLGSELHIESLGLRSKVLRKLEELRAVPVSDGVPDEYLCPITHEVMKDPVIAADGYSYEREAIESWISTKSRTSPMTNLPLHTTLLTPNRTLKMAIFRWTSRPLNPTPPLQPRPQGPTLQTFNIYGIWHMASYAE
ncbi:WD repeat, SAM and U-box domain-containing protein 1 [Brachyhypopomus gauderio]|uniref:WD repeat, SAM and U-box domain-containing protein 1 n=1 Tax=Brachyhypopomus gauderio TaxID=698409 RepID=UPI0040417485